MALNSEAQKISEPPCATPVSTITLGRNVKIAGDQKLTPFPHWMFSTRTPDKRYAMLSEPVSDWFVSGLVAQSLEPWHPPGVYTSQDLHNAVDFYYNLGALLVT